MSAPTSWLSSPRSVSRGWLVGIGLGGLLYATLRAFPAEPWVERTLFGIACCVGCVAYEHANPVTGMRNFTRLPCSRSRGWLVGLVTFALLANMGGKTLDALLKAHEWLALGLVVIAWWVGYRSYEHPNPLLVMLKDVRQLLPPHVIVWAVVGVLAFFFAEPVKTALGSILPTDVPGLAAMLFGMLIVLAWETESEARKTREELKDIRDKLQDFEMSLVARARADSQGGRLPL